MTAGSLMRQINMYFAAMVLETPNVMKQEITTTWKSEVKRIQFLPLYLLSLSVSSSLLLVLLLLWFLELLWLPLLSIII